MKKRSYKSFLVWGIKILAAVILLQSLYFKFTSQPISIDLFSQLGVEPWGRYLVGIIELIASALILIPSTALVGSVLVSIVGIGAILTHLFFIGVSFGGDVSLFFLAILVFVLGILSFVIERKKSKHSKYQK